QQSHGPRLPNARERPFPRAEQRQPNPAAPAPWRSAPASPTQPVGLPPGGMKLCHMPLSPPSMTRSAPVEVAATPGPSTSEPPADLAAPQPPPPLVANQAASSVPWQAKVLVEPAVATAGWPLHVHGNGPQPDTGPRDQIRPPAPVTKNPIVPGTWATAGPAVR